MLFDFDGTLTTRDTTRYLIKSLLRLRPSLVFVVAPRLLGMLSMRFRNKLPQASKYRCIGRLLRGLSPQEVQPAMISFAAAARPLFRTWLMAVLDDHRRHGRGILIVTASPQLAVEPLFPEEDIEVIGAEFLMADGRFSGELKGIGCYGEAKSEALARWLAGREDGVVISEAWSDSLSDIPVMLMAARRNWICSARALPAMERADPQGTFHGPE